MVITSQHLVDIVEHQIHELVETLEGALDLAAAAELDDDFLVGVFGKVENGFFFGAVGGGAGAGAGAGAGSVVGVVVVGGAAGCWVGAATAAAVVAVAEGAAVGHWEVMTGEPGDGGVWSVERVVDLSHSNNAV